MAAEVPMDPDAPIVTGLETRRPQMFPALSAAQMARVMACGTERTFADGAIVFEQGDSDVPCYVVLEGELVIVHPQGRVEELITVHRRHEFTGEISIITSARTLVRGRARGAVRLLRIENARLKSLIQTDAELSELFMRAFILRRIGLVATGSGDAVVIG